ncbi:MAG TPA: ABC transporter permease [Candidatus Dormibacteraeota bacterium]|nr:ABC transporter permease [Candidatus Dormibacteraeota bacterium]
MSASGGAARGGDAHTFAEPAPLSSRPPATRGPLADVRQVVAIARLTVLEATRKKLVIALLVITALVIALSTVMFSRLGDITVGRNATRLTPGEIRTFTSQFLVFIMFMFSFVLALSAVFMASPAISGEIESGVALAILTRPVARAQVLLGKWLGLGVLVVAYVAGSSLVEFALTDLGTGYFPPHPWLFMAYMAGETLVILTLAILVSTRLPAMAGGIVALGAFGMAWVGGIVGAIGAAFGNGTIANIGTATRLLVPSDALWHGAHYALEPDAVIAGANAASRAFAANPFIAVQPPPPTLDLWAAAWIVAVLALAIWSFRAREI